MQVRKIPKIRNRNQLKLEIEKSRHEVNLHKHVLFSGVNDLRRNIVDSVVDTAKSITQKWLMLKTMKWVQSLVYNARKKRKRKKK
ncbi:MAG: hypothetical protein KDC05_04255 [Bacteroidales bacterium]|nr:hypothetical protein [Bacteroidales bacterium]